MSTILVLGGTGKTGRRIARHLSAAGHHVRVASRHLAEAAPGITPVAFDWAEPATHPAALDGVDAVYVVPPAFVVDPVDQLTRFYGEAARAGVGRAVLLSARGVDADESIPLRRAELALFDSDLPGSVIRPTWFNQNFTEGVFADGVRDGVVVTAAGDGLVPFIDADDIAEVSATLLTTDEHDRVDGTAFDLSGPEALSFAQTASILSGALGRPVAHVAVTTDEFVAGAASAGVPADYAAMLGSLFDVIRNGWDAHVSDGVERALGRSPRSFEEWAATSLRPVAG